MSENPISVESLIGEGKYKEALIFGIDNLAGVIDQDLVTKNREYWIDSFNNKTGGIFMLTGLVEISPDQQEKLNGLISEKGELKILSTKIKIRLEKGLGGDADESERERLIDLVKEIKECFI